MRVSEARFAIYGATFLALLWGCLASGAFFRSGLAGFSAVALIAGGVALVRRRSRASLRWWAVTVLPMVLAIVVSAAANHSLTDAPYAVLPVLAAAGLGLVGSLAVGIDERRFLLGLVADVTCVLAVLSWLGVAGHISAWAILEAQGWRASATIGYANVAGLVMLVGLVCAVNRAARRGRLRDEVCCWLLATGVFATQSRSAAVALVACLVLLAVTCRPMAKELGRALPWSILTLAGLLPSIGGRAPHLVVAVLAAAASATGLIAIRGRTLKAAARWLGGAVVALAVAGIGLDLRHRLFDWASGQARPRLWHGALQRIAANGVFGQGPHQLAEFGRGHMGPLMVHNDPLQYAQFYGVLGVAAFAVAGWRLARALWERRTMEPNDLWPTALSVAVAVGCAMVVDFPLQIPIVTALLCLIVGLTLQPAHDQGKHGYAPVAI